MKGAHQATDSMGSWLSFGWLISYLVFGWSSVGLAGNPGVNPV